MMELYVHIPYCVRKCRYCDFASFSGMENTMAEYVDSLIAEAKQRAEQLAPSEISTVFIGGGTPSVLPADLFKKLLAGICSTFPIAEGSEFTCEANPGTVTEEWLRIGAKYGVNRISLGMQSYQPELLSELGRIHQFPQVEEAVDMCRKQGISNINLDLMFGLPNQQLCQWQETLRHAVALHPTHISCYSLIPEEGTPLKADLDSGKLALPDEDTDRDMYDYAIKYLDEMGYRQYEISNFALPGCKCSHNMGYWEQVPYIGLGASSCSMIMESMHPMTYRRETNVHTINEYILQSHAHFTRETESISSPDAMFETLMLGFRETSGVSESHFEKLHGISIGEVYGKRLHKLEKQGLVEHQCGAWHLTRSGMDVQNYVLVELMD